MTTTSPPTTTVAARAEKASKIYGEGDTAVHALDSVDVDFERERFTAIMGPSGSGKSTLLHCIAGLDRLTSGEVWLGSTPLGQLSEKELTQGPPGQDRVRVPGVQPDPDAHRDGEHHPADGARGS